MVLIQDACALVLPQRQTATLGRGSAPRMEQASVPDHSAGLILLWVQAPGKVKSVPPPEDSLAVAAAHIWQ